MIAPILILYESGSRSACLNHTKSISSAKSSLSVRHVLILVMPANIDWLWFIENEVVTILNFNGN